MNQKLSWGLFLVGGALFLTAFGHELQAHSSWASLVTPDSVGEMLVELGTVIVTVAGALGITLKKD